MLRQKSPKAILEELRGVFRDADEHFDNCSEMAEKYRLRSWHTADRIVKDIVLNPDRPVWPETKSYRASKAKLATTPGQR